MSHIGITSESIARPAPGLHVPLSLQFSPDEKTLTYLFQEDSSSRQLFGVDCTSSDFQPRKMLDTSEENTILTAEEALRRERMRLFADGVVSYEWVGNNSIMLPFNGKVMQVNPDNSTSRILYDASAGACIDPHMSPDASSLAFVMNDNLWIQHITASNSGNGNNTSMPTRLTENGLASGIQCGAADYIAQEEMDRYRGYWWSKDSQYIAYTETDENNVQEYSILHQGKSDPKHSETNRYPFAGENNPFVKLAVLKVPTVGSTDPPESIWMDLTGDNVTNPQIDSNDYYLGRVGWWSDGSIMAQVENREQTILQLLRLDVITGKRSILIEEKSSIWINLHDMLYEEFPPNWTPSGNVNDKEDGDFYFIWGSERSGYSQLYLYQYISSTKQCVVLLDGQPIGGGGNWVVQSIEAVDTVNNLIYFMGNDGNASEKHLYCASFDTTNGNINKTQTKQRITKQNGTHMVAVSLYLGMYADVYSSLSALPTMSLHKLPGINNNNNNDDNDNSNNDTTLLKEILNRDLSHPYPAKDLIPLVAHIVPPTIEVIRSSDDKVDLYCAVYRPDPANHGDGPFPCIMSVYGGPHVMRVTDSWSTSVDLRAQRLSKLGYVVIRCDNRGSFHRGIEFEGALKYDMGNIEVVDQQTAVDYFVKNGLVDPSRVGMFGWSYGGYMSAMSLCRAPETFCCAIAGAPVTSWDGYDTHYTERYMGTPQNNPQGYKDSSVMEYTQNMKGSLMLIHGLIDENVHFRHTARLINALIKHRKRYDLVLFPCERHSPHKEQDKIYLEDRMLDFIKEKMPCNNQPTVLLKPPSPKYSSGKK